jgi:hypothetical protein
MAFSNTEKINSANKLSQQITGSADENPGIKHWYNEDHEYVPTISPSHIWNDFYTLPGAATPTEADTNVLLFPALIEKSKIRLTHNTTSNYRQFECRMVFGDRTSGMYENWLQPSLIKKDGSLSAGYIVRFYHGDPDLVGFVELPTSYLSSTDGSPSWEFNYSMGLLKVATSNSSTYENHFNDNGLFIVGYRYIGTTGGGGAGTGNTLNQSYNQGGPGAGRIITVNSGPVEFLASGNCAIYADGYLSLNSIAEPTPRANKGNLYSSNPGSGTSELFYMDNNGATTQITEDGYLATANSLTRVGLYAHPNDPHMNPGEGFLYAKPVSTGLELFFMDGKGRAIQITKDGKLSKR